MLHKHLLMIDDEELIREVASLSMEMTEAGSVTTAASGSAGVLLAQSKPPDAILLDVMMPDMDGPTTLCAPRTPEAPRSILVIFLTAKVQGGYLRGFLQLGAQ